MEYLIIGTFTILLYISWISLLLLFITHFPIIALVIVFLLIAYGVGECILR